MPVDERAPNKYTIQVPVTQMKYRCLPVDYCFPASIDLFMEDYNIHTINSHIPQWLPLTVVPIVYRSMFELTQHLFYGRS